MKVTVKYTGMAPSIYEEARYIQVLDVDHGNYAIFVIDRNGIVNGHSACDGVEVDIP